MWVQQLIHLTLEPDPVGFCELVSESDVGPWGVVFPGQVVCRDQWEVVGDVACDHPRAGFREVGGEDEIWSPQGAGEGGQWRMVLEA